MTVTTAVTVEVQARLLAGALEVNIDKVVYFINLGLTKFTLASGRRRCVRAVYSGLDSKH